MLRAASMMSCVSSFPLSKQDAVGMSCCCSSWQDIRGHFPKHVLAEEQAYPGATNPDQCMSCSGLCKCLQLSSNSTLCVSIRVTNFMTECIEEQWQSAVLQPMPHSQLDRRSERSSHAIHTVASFTCMPNRGSRGCRCCALLCGHHHAERAGVPDHGPGSCLGTIPGGGGA